MRKIACIAVFIVILAAGCISNGPPPPHATPRNSSSHVYGFDATLKVSRVSDGTTVYHSLRVGASANCVETGYWLDYAVVNGTTYPATERTMSNNKLTGTVTIIVSNKLLWFYPPGIDAWTYTVDRCSTVNDSIYTFWVHSEDYHGMIIVTTY